MRISEVCAITGLTASAIRFYEQKRLIRDIRRDKHGIRDFSEEDLKWVKFLTSMKNAGLSMEAIMSYAELYYNNNENLTERLTLTEGHKEMLIKKMAELQEGVDFLDYKINLYKKLIKEEK